MSGNHYIFSFMNNAKPNCDSQIYGIYEKWCGERFIKPTEREGETCVSEMLRIWEELHQSLGRPPKSEEIIAQSRSLRTAGNFGEYK